MITKLEILHILNSLIRKEYEVYSPPTEADWKALETKFNTKFSQTFVNFMELLSEYSFPGNILLVAKRSPVDNDDTILIAYECEMSMGDWDIDLIPFQDIGNGDYFCLSAKEGETSAVYYVYHEDRCAEKLYDNFDEWIRGMPDFCNYKR